MLNLEGICLPIKKDLADVEAVIQKHTASSVAYVTSISEYVIKNAGKRLRPMLCLFSSRLAGASGPKVTDCAAAMEFFHTATLMHDDVIDNAKLRRGKTSANSRWGNQVAVLVGDFFYCQASSLLVGTGNLRIINMVTKAMLSTTEGEILEISKSNDLGTTEQDYLKIVTDKTAVLMATSCAIGGVLGNVSEEYVTALGEYGRNLGVAFQLADDVLDYISDDAFGKTQGTDLREGKLTLPLITALRHCNNDERRLIKDVLIAENLDDARLRDVIGIINRYGGIENTFNLARSYVQKAKDALSPFKPSMEQEALITLASYVIDRKQ
ncbi:MAG TPA: polyprenyl synthetase family protein [bacterium]|nr:polyprenyl synthetase family protein [bacterium]